MALKNCAATSHKIPFDEKTSLKHLDEKASPVVPHVTVGKEKHCLKVKEFEILRGYLTVI